MLTATTLGIYPNQDSGVIVMRIDTKENMTIMYQLEPGAARKIIQCLKTALQEFYECEASPKN